MDLVAIIPARSGSKRLPGKNLLPIGGKPMLQWTIEAALGAKSVKRVIVSTEDPATAEVARKAGAEVPFQRPAQLADDQASNVDVTLHALHWIQQHDGQMPSTVVLLQPSSPLRTAADIDAARELMLLKQATCLLSVSELGFQTSWIKAVDAESVLLPGDQAPGAEAGRLCMFNGAIFMIESGVLQETKKFLQPRTVAYIMPRERSIDIDTRYDFFQAEQLLLASLASGGVLRF